MISTKKGFLLLLLFAVFHTHVIEAQNDAALVKKANIEFQSGNFSVALNDYRQLLSKEPKSIDFNYKYATCLYHTDDINKATKYYDLILNMYDPPKESYFYRGKIYQNNYDFQKAIKAFEKYKSLLGKKDVDLGADIEINHCKNALQFIKAPGTFKTLKRFEANRADFFQNYSFKNVMYSFYKEESIFKKQNSKHNHIPRPATYKKINYRLFASYGTNAESGKDIYIQKKIGETGWTDPIRLGSEVNSNADEDFPFYDEEKGILYFSSTGHNSMGGYDIFKVDFDLTKNTASNRENLNFPFSSPNDDLFLVPDMQTKNAYFASNRNGQLGKVEVFYIELSEKPIELTFISGKLTDQIDELNKSVQIKIVNELSKEQFGPFYSDEDGNFLVSVPKEGTYNFQIKVSGSSKEFSETVDIPKISDSKKLNQEILYSMQDSKENLEIITRILDKENLSAKMELIKYKEMAKLYVNDGTLVTEVKREKESDLADLGYSEDSVQAFEKLTDDLLDVQLDIEKNLKFEEELISKLDSNQFKLENYSNEIVKLNEEINTSNDARDKYKLETEKRNIEKEVQTIKKQNYVLAKEIQAISENKLISRETLLELKSINEGLNEKLINSNYSEAKSIVSNKKNEISQLLDNRLGDKENLEKQKETQLIEQKNILDSQIAEQVKQINELKNQISTTQQKLNSEKNKKEQERLQGEIRQLNKNLVLVEELNSEAQFSLNKLQKEQEAYNENKELLSKIDLRAEDKKSFQDVKSVPKSKLQPDNLINEIVENETVLNSTPEGKYEQDIARIQQITNETERKTQLIVREKQYQTELKQKLEASSSESEKEIYSEQIQLSQSRLVELDNDYAQINQNEKIEDPTNKSVENNSTSNEIAKNEIQNTTQNENVNEPTIIPVENNSTSNQVAKNEVQKTQNEKVEEPTNKSVENNSTSNQVAKNEVPKTTQNENVEETTNNSVENNSTSYEIAKNEVQNTTQNEKVEEPTYKSVENNSTSNEVAKNEVPKTTQNENAEDPTNKSVENNSTSNEVAENEVPKTQNEKVEEPTNKSDENNSTSNEVAKNEVQKTTQNENVIDPTNNPDLKSELSNSQDDLKQSVLYNLNAATIERQIEIKKEEITRASSLNEKERIEKELSQLEEESQINYKRSLEIEKRALFNKQFPDLNIRSNLDKIAELNELKMKENFIQKKIANSSNEQEKRLLSEQKNQLTAIRSDLENRLGENEIKQKSVVSYQIPQPSVELSNEEKAVLSQDESYIKYIDQRIIYNKLFDGFEQTKAENQKLREKINKILIESETNMLTDELMELGFQLRRNEESLNKTEIELKDQLEKLNSFDKLKQFEWMLINGVQPTKRIVANENLQQTFFIGRNPNIVDEKPLPINVNAPSGLVYRVQVGAFRKPIPNDAFRDFSPVSGDVLANGLTCYMAGYFNSAQNAINARKQIRALGYADAFIVAYCDGKRISFAKGRELEISSQCKTLSNNELILALNQNITDSNTKNVASNLVQQPNQTSQNYLDVPNAKKSEIGEMNQHLFFTVQVGVYNKPITNEQLKSFDDLITFKTEKGQFRYSSGMFESVNDAKTHKTQAIAKGVADAYVVAYYQGKRISIAEANNLLAQNGPAILKKSIKTKPNTNSNLSGSIVSIDMQLPNLKSRINQDTLIQYLLVCEEDEIVTKLEKLNRIGIFTYQSELGKIVTPKMKTSEVSHIQKEYFKEFKIENQKIDSNLVIQFDVTNKLSNGSFTDWLMRSECNYRIDKKEDMELLSLYLISEYQRDMVIRKAEEFSISIKNK